jgi:hypothetical protein
MCRRVGGMPKPDGASSAEKLGDDEVVARVGGVARAVKDGIDVAGGAKFGDVDVGNEADVKFDDNGSYKVDVMKEGEAVGRKFGDTGVFTIAGRKFGDIANESARFDGAVANSALKSGDVEPIKAVGASCTELLGHTASAPFSTRS